MNDIPHRTQVHGAEFVLDQAVVAPDDPPNPVSVVDTAAHQGPDAGIHPRGIAPAGQDRQVPLG